MELLERDASLCELDAALHDAINGAGRVALVSGEAGIGKTSLVERFVREQQDSARVLWGACDDLFTPHPFGPLHDIATQTQGNLLALLNSDTDCTAIFSAVLGELQRGPVIAVFEDVHWADEATLDLLRFLGRRIARTAALLVLTYRDDELNLRHPLRTLLGNIASSSAVRRIALAPLSQQAVRTLVGPRPIDACALHHQTEGNPFFVSEVLANGGVGLPPTVRDAVLARTARLSPTAQTVLHAAAVIGPRIEPWVLATVAGVEVEPIEECLSIGMLRAQGQVLAFRHELARQIVLQAISPLLKTVLHRMALDALRGSPAARADLACLAHHAEAAGDHAAVLEYAPAAARQAAAVGAHRAAAALYALALRFATDLPLDAHARLLEQYAEQCDYVGQQTEGIAGRRAAVTLWHQLGDTLKQGENLAYLMSMLNRIGQNAEAEQVCRASIELLEALPPGRELALAYRMQAAILLVNRDCDEALVWAEKALNLAERFKDLEVLAAVHVTIGTAWLFLDYERGCAYLEQSLAVARDAGLCARVTHMYTNLGSASGELYQFHRASHYLTTGIEYASERDLDSSRHYMVAWQALVDMYLGQWPAAADAATQVLNSLGVTVISRITALVALGRLRARHGDSGVSAALDEALELATRADNLQRLGPVRVARAEAAWLAGNYERAGQEARAVYDLAVSKRHPWIAGELAFWRWRAGDDVALPTWLALPFALQIAGDWRAAANEWQRLGCPYEQARALAEGDDTARMEALGIFERLGAKPAADDLRRVLRAKGVLRIPRGPRSSTRENPFGLTAREMDILHLLTARLSNTEIATRLYISPKTVDHHVSAVLSKLDVHSREAAAAVARQHTLRS
jgi:DNA-binding CsgD family transcriptional regulator